MCCTRVLTSIATGLQRAASLKFQAIAMAVAGLFAATATQAATFDFNVPAGNYTNASNWVDETNTNGVPGAADTAHVRNAGTVTIDSDVFADAVLLGYFKEDPNQPYIEDPNNPGTFIPDPNNILPSVGSSGTLNWTGGELSTPELRVGETHTGIVNQTGGVIHLLDSTSPDGVLQIGNNTTDGSSVYNLIGGRIGIQIGINGNNGINVRHGTFNMSGGEVIDETGTTNTGQRMLSIATTNNAVSVATISGGTIDGRGGIRVALNSGSNGTLNVTGAGAFIGTMDDLSIGYHDAGYGEMNMSAGTVRVGTPDESARLQIGHRGVGVLNMSGGSIVVHGDMRVAAEDDTDSSSVYMTGGTLQVEKLETRRDPNKPGTDDLGGEFVIDGPNALLIQEGEDAVIGRNGTFLFEIRQGEARIDEFQLGETPNSKGSVSVAGGKLLLKGDVLKDQLAAAPTFGFTGGTIEVNTGAASSNWHVDLVNDGGTLDLTPGARHALVVGDASRPSDFLMNAGSWNIEVASNVTNSGADFINVLNGTGGLLGGTLNISHIAGYMPSIGDTVRIVRSASGSILLDEGGLTLLGDPNWRTVLGAGGSEIHLTYVPEPASIFLIGLGLFMAAASARSSRP